MSIEKIAASLADDLAEIAHGERASAKAVLVSLANAHNARTGRCDPSVARIAAETCLHRATVLRAIRSLAESGRIEVTQRPGCRSAYDLRPVAPRDRSHHATGSTMLPVAPCYRSHRATGPVAPCDTNRNTGRLRTHSPGGNTLEIPARETPDPGGPSHAPEAVSSADLFPAQPSDSDCQPPMEASQPTTDEDRWRMSVSAEPWARALRRAGAKVGPRNWTAWKRLIDELVGGDLETMLAFVAELPPDNRWPDVTESEWRRRRGHSVGDEVVIL